MTANAFQQLIKCLNEYVTTVGANACEHDIKALQDAEKVLNNPQPIEEFIHRTNFDQLKQQKKAVIEILDRLEKSGDDMAEVFEGLLNFIDSFQDLAVDSYGYNEKSVFDLSEEEEG
jgi:hypothetical protein